MGMSLSNRSFVGSCSTFHYVRNLFVQAAGIKLMEHKDFPGYEYADIDWDGIKDEFGDYTLIGLWADKPEDPLYYLMCHSDCDGMFPWEICQNLADRLAALLWKIYWMPDVPGHITDMCFNLVRGFYESYNKKENIYFW